MALLSKTGLFRVQKLLVYSSAETHLELTYIFLLCFCLPWKTARLTVQAVTVLAWVSPFKKEDPTSHHLHTRQTGGGAQEESLRNRTAHST